MKTTLRLTGAMFALGVMVRAQNPNAPGQAKKDDAAVVVTPVDPVATERAALNNAQALAKTPAANEAAKAQTAAAVEALLTPTNKTQPNTADWRLETAQRLMQVAELAARAGKADNVAALATRALQQLNVADNPSQDATTRAAAKTLAAWIYERYLADLDSARANYEAAVQLSPGNQKAKESAARLKQTDDNVKLKPVRN